MFFRIFGGMYTGRESKSIFGPRNPHLPNESVEIKKKKISNKKEDLPNVHFAEAFKRLENCWKEEKHCDVTLIAVADGAR